MGILLHKTCPHAAQPPSQACCTETSSCQSSHLPEFSSASTRKSLWRVSWLTQPSMSRTCSGQISWVQANIWESIGVNAQGCTQQQPLVGMTKLGMSVLGKTHLPWLSHPGKEPFCSIGGGEGRKPRPCNTALNPPEMNNLVWLGNATWTDKKLVKATCSQSTCQNTKTKDRSFYQDQV